jgi:hypothetical protein
MKSEPGKGMEYGNINATHTKTNKYGKNGIN